MHLEVLLVFGQTCQLGAAGAASSIPTVNDNSTSSLVAQDGKSERNSVNGAHLHASVGINALPASHSVLH